MPLYRDDSVALEARVESLRGEQRQAEAELRALAEKLHERGWVERALARRRLLIGVLVVLVLGAGAVGASSVPLWRKRQANRQALQALQQERQELKAAQHKLRQLLRRQQGEKLRLEQRQREQEKEITSVKDESKNIERQSSWLIVGAWGCAEGDRVLVERARRVLDRRHRLFLEEACRKVRWR